MSTPKPEFQLILVDPNTALCQAWQEKFKDYPEVSIVNGLFQRIEAYDCIVSAANSFGQMDGGVDLAITNFFGTQLQFRVQQHIVSEYFGEQPVGTSFIIETNHERFPFLAHTPTMRVPMPITNTDNVYNAMFAMLRTVSLHNRKPENRKIKTVVCPGLGTNTGKVPAEEAARQMELAYRNFSNPPAYLSWFHISGRQSEIIFGGDVLL